MEKEFIPCELAVKLKALGFDEPCFGWYENNELVTLLECIYPEDRLEFIKVGEISKRISAPTFSQAFRWFREKYAFYVVIKPFNAEFSCIIWTSKAQNHIGIFKTYEEAEFACLDKLIEAVESKSEQG